jgi:hypothetical protein
MKLRTLAFSLLLLTCAPLSADQIYKHIDEKGRVTYSNSPIKGGQKVDLPPLSTVTLPKPPAAQSEAKPLTDADKAQRKKQLQEAIAAEEKALEDAKTKASAGDASAATQHEKKLADLKAELGRLDAKP